MYYERIIIGSGPSALGYLLGLNQGKRKGLIVSTDKLPYSGNESLHPKLYGEGFKYIEKLVKQNYGPTCNWGGLSVAWGGLLVLPSQPVSTIDSYGHERLLVNENYIETLQYLSQELPLYSLIDGKFSLIHKPEDITVASEIYLLSGKEKYAWPETLTTF